jgi:hypothetical protein
MKAYFQFLIYISLYCFSVILNTGCSRPNINGKTSVISIMTPKRSEIVSKVKTFSQALPDNKVYCFAITVKGTGIEEVKSSADLCQASLGLSSGFVQESESLTLDVPKGSDRSFELFLYLAEPGTVCPVLNDSFFSNIVAYSKTYQVGKTSSVNLTQDNESVEIELDFKGLAQNLMVDSGLSSCSVVTVISPVPSPIVEQPLPSPIETPPVVVEPSPVISPLPPPAPKLWAMLYSDGSIVEAGLDVSTLNKSWIESFFTLLADVFDLAHIEAIGAAHNTTQDLMTSGGIVVPPYLHSFSTDPVTGDLFALGEGGDIYKIDKSNGSITSFTCPFSSCQLPQWVQSISVGRDGNIFALDHAGQIYHLEATGLALLTDAVSPSVVQVLYY